MLEIGFEPLGTTDDALLGFAVIVSRHKGRWIFCKHRNRDTWEVPGGHIEPGEDALAAARRELREETGAQEFELWPVCTYFVRHEAKSYGLLCFAEVARLGPLPDSEIELAQLFDTQPDALTYPQIQPMLFSEVKRWLSAR